MRLLYFIMRLLLRLWRSINEKNLLKSVGMVKKYKKISPRFSKITKMKVSFAKSYYLR